VPHGEDWQRAAEFVKRPSERSPANEPDRAALSTPYDRPTPARRVAEAAAELRKVATDDRQSSQARRDHRRVIDDCGDD
jgi:hypothetical protein